MWLRIVVCLRWTRPAGIDSSADASLRAPSAVRGSAVTDWCTMAFPHIAVKFLHRPIPVIEEMRTQPTQPAVVRWCGKLRGTRWFTWPRGRVETRRCRFSASVIHECKSEQTNIINPNCKNPFCSYFVHCCLPLWFCGLWSAASLRFHIWDPAFFFFFLRMEPLKKKYEYNSHIVMVNTWPKTHRLVSSGNEFLGIQRLPREKVRGSFSPSCLSWRATAAAVFTWPTRWSLLNWHTNCSASSSCFFFRCKCILIYFMRSLKNEEEQKKSCFCEVLNGPCTFLQCVSAFGEVEVSSKAWTGLELSTWVALFPYLNSYLSFSLSLSLSFFFFFFLTR